MQKKRSVVIILLGWFLIINAIIPLIRRISDLIKWDFHRGFPAALFYDWILVLFFIAGAGLLMFKDWARKLTIILLSIKLLFYTKSIYLTFTSVFKNTSGITTIRWFDIVSIIIYLVLIFSLIRPKIKEFFDLDKKQFISTWIIGLSIFYIIYVFMPVLMYVSKMDQKFLRFAFQLVIFSVVIKMILPPLIIGGFLFYTLRNKKM